MNAADAVVVGGGFAGVTAARELASAGRHTILLEARDRLGGRTWTTELGGETLELGGTWVHWHQPHVWSELTRYGIGIEEDDWRYDAALFGSPPRRYPADEAFARVNELFARYVGDGAERLRHPHDPLAAHVTELDRLSMADRLDELRLPEPEREWLTGLLYEIAGSPLEDAGLLQVLRWMALCDWSVDGWYETNRYRPAGGTAALIEAMLGDGRVEVRLRSPVRAIDVAGDAVRLTTRDGETLRATTVVVAVPVNVWSSIAFAPDLPPSHREAARVGMGKPHQDKVWVLARGRIGRIFAQLPAPAPLNFFWTYRTWEDRQLIFGINANPALDVTDEAKVAETIRGYVPEIEEVLEIRAHNWAADEFSRGGNTCYRPGQLTRHLAGLQRPWGRVAFATADIASGWVGYIDGAIESGIRAARHCRSV